MDLQQIKSQLLQLQSTVHQLEEATTASNPKTPPAVLQGEAIRNLRDMQIAVEGTERYLANLRFQSLESIALLVAVKSGIIHTLSEAREKPLSANFIATACNLDKDVVVRIARFLSSRLRVCDDAGFETYKANKLTEALDTPFHDGYLDMFASIHLPTLGTFPTFLDIGGLRHLGKEPSPFNHHFGGTLWQVLEKDPALKKVFDRVFSLRAQQNKGNLWSTCSVRSMLAGTSAEIFIVDIGGNQGQDLAAFIKQHPEYTSARLVLQDLPHTIDGIAPGSLSPNIELQAYDFFSGPQPIKGSAVYFMHDIIHDFDDQQALIILKHTAQAMNSTSRLLIADWVIRDQNAQQTACYIDWTMMMITSGGMERSLAQWTGLLTSAGLEIVKVWELREEGQSVIETREGVLHKQVDLELLRSWAAPPLPFDAIRPANLRTRKQCRPGIAVGDPHQKAHHWSISGSELHSGGGEACRDGPGSDLTWVPLFVKWPEVQKKAWEQIDAVVDEGRSPVWKDYRSLPRVAQIVKESMRWRPVTPLAFPHAIDEDDWIDGMKIPKGSIVFINSWGLQHDETRFKDPDRFDPDHYKGVTALAPELAAASDPELRDHYGYGSGRRICPGMHLAERNMFLAFAKLLWAFEFLPKEDENGNPMVMDIDPQTAYSEGFLVCAKDYKLKVTVRSAKKRDTIVREFEEAKRDVLSKFEA